MRSLTVCLLPNWLIIAAAGHIVGVAEAVAGHLQAEITAGDRLRDLLQPRRCAAAQACQHASMLCHISRNEPAAGAAALSLRPAFPMSPHTYFPPSPTVLLLLQRRDECG